MSPGRQVYRQFVDKDNNWPLGRTILRQMADSCCQSDVACQCVAVLVNRIDGDLIASALEFVVTDYWSTTVSATGSIRLRAWLSRALIMRGDRAASAVLPHTTTPFLLALIEQLRAAPDEMGCAAALDAFRILTEPIPDDLMMRRHESRIDMLNAANDCRISPLWRQRLFQLVFPMLAQCCDKDSADEQRRSEDAIQAGDVAVIASRNRVALLSVLGRLIAIVPKALVTESTLARLMPLQIEALHQQQQPRPDDGDTSEGVVILWKSAIECIRQLLAAASKPTSSSGGGDEPSNLPVRAAVLDHLSMILLRLLELSRFSQSMTLRIDALECLAEFARPAMLELLSAEQLLRHRSSVLQRLGPAISDRKRLVRRAAVGARSSWFLIGQPGTS